MGQAATNFPVSAEEEAVLERLCSTRQRVTIPAREGAGVFAWATVSRHRGLVTVSAASRSDDRVRAFPIPPTSLERARLRIRRCRRRDSRASRKGPANGRTPRRIALRRKESRAAWALGTALRRPRRFSPDGEWTLALVRGACADVRVTFDSQASYVDPGAEHRARGPQ